jgi:hypothetical protein
VRSRFETEVFSKDIEIFVIIREREVGNNNEIIPRGIDIEEFIDRLEK